MSYDFTKLKKNLEQKGYQMHIFDTKEEAAEYLDNQIDGKTVGMGGSVTLHQLGIYEKLAPHNTVYWHGEKTGNMTDMETRQAATRSEVYISSVNGISEAGEIVNIDHMGNRVAAIAFGPTEVYLVLGENKVAPDLDAAMHRARNIAAPLNAKRLNRKTPCAVNADKCYDCKSPERICRNFSVLTDKPAGAKYVVLLVRETLGY